MQHSSYHDDEMMARVLQEEEDAAMARAVSEAPPVLMPERDVELVSIRQLASKRWFIVAFAVLDVCGIFILLLQRSDDGFPLSAKAFFERWDGDLTRVAWFAPLVLSLPFPAVGIVGALLLHRWMLWTYVTWLLVAIVVRLVLALETGRLEGLVDQDRVVVDMVLYSAFVFLDLSTLCRASALALAISRLQLHTDTTARRRQPSRAPLHRPRFYLPRPEARNLQGAPSAPVLGEENTRRGSPVVHGGSRRPDMSTSHV
mmetsp:Transcript_34548/g.111529  ORF Transcript_34548/g.111529 Transcript_34548/m.111529 type:complete len:258 (+) Transcript_34548:87-860(+)